MKHASYITCLLVVFLFGCNDSNSKLDKDASDFVKQWNDTHTQLKAAYLERNYMDVVMYYGKERTKQQVQQDKKLLFQQFPDYSQGILNDKLEITKEAESYLLTFTNRIKYNGKTADYVMYLSVIYKNHKFKILREGVAENSKNNDTAIFPYARENNAVFTKNRQLFGDFNGDGLSDYASVRSPDINTSNQSDTDGRTEVICNGGCNSVITFSNKNLREITVEGAYQSQLENLKDLNSDGADEIGFWDIKPTTKSLNVYDVNNGVLLIEPVVINTKIHRNLDLIDVFKKTGPNKITVTHSELENGKWILKSEVITLD